MQAQSSSASSGSGGAVISVAGKTGVVVLEAADITDFDVEVANNTTVTLNTAKVTNQFTGADETKLDGIEALAEVNNISDVNATDLTDAGDSALHFHSTDRDRSNHTGTQAASTISDFDTEVSNNSSVMANTAKVTNQFTAADESKLDGIEALAEVNTVDSVAGKTGVVTLTAADVTDFDTEVSNNPTVSSAEQTANKDVNNGYCPLDGAAKVPTANLPASVQNGNYLGPWNASTNTPTLADSDSATNGDNYLVSVSGSQDLGHGTVSYNAGDEIKFNATTPQWDEFGRPDNVQSVAGKQGVVTLVASDITDFDTEVANNSAVVLNTAKVTNQFTAGDETKLDGIEALAEVNNISDVNATDLTDGGDSTLHFHASDRDRANHTGTQTASTISDFDTEVDELIGSVDSLIDPNEDRLYGWDDSAGESVTEQVSGGLLLSDNILKRADTRVVIAPAEFVPYDDKDWKQQVENNGASIIDVDGKFTDFIITAKIPVGFKATAFMVYAEDAVPSVEIFENLITDGSTAVSKGSGNANTEVNMTDVDYSANNYLSIIVSDNGKNFYGAYVSIEVI